MIATRPCHPGATQPAAIILSPVAALAQDYAVDDWRAKWPEVTIGIGTDENAQSAVERWDHFAAYMQGCMKVAKVVMRVASDYSAIIEAQANGDVQLHWAGPAAYAIGRDISGGNMEPIAMDVSPNGELGYRWVIAVKADSPYQAMEDLKGKSLGWPTPGSASGYVLPMQFFRENGMVNASNEPVFFGNLVQTGSHDNGLVAVVQGTIDATTNWYYSPAAGNHTRAAGAGTIKLEDIRFIFESEVVPNAPFVVTKDLPEPMKRTMQQCIVNMSWIDPEAFAKVGKDVFGVSPLPRTKTTFPSSRSAWQPSDPGTDDPLRHVLAAGGDHQDLWQRPRAGQCHAGYRAWRNDRGDRAVRGGKINAADGDQPSDRSRWWHHDLRGARCAGAAGARSAQLAAAHRDGVSAVQSGVAPVGADQCDDRAAGHAAADPVAVWRFLR
jgi:phosphonate transport system substrate-binding protein